MSYIKTKRTTTKYSGLAKKEKKIHILQQLTLHYDENVIQKFTKTVGMSFVVVCGKMGQEEDVAQESKVKELDQ